MMNIFGMFHCAMISWLAITVGRTDGQLDEQNAQLSQRDRAAGHINFGQKWKTGTAR